MKIESANQVSGRAVGAIIFTAFGALWLVLGLYARQLLNPSAFAAVGAGLFLLLAGALALVRQSSRWPRVPEDPLIGRRFTGVNVLQGLAIFIAVTALSRLHLDRYVMNAITGIVGLHLFPLARLFRYSLHRLSGALLVTWAVVSLWLTPVERLQSTTALGTGALLWLSAASTLILAFAAARQNHQPVHSFTD